jgi:hypothetical protein
MAAPALRRCDLRLLLRTVHVHYIRTVSDTVSIDLREILQRTPRLSAGLQERDAILNLRNNSAGHGNCLPIIASVVEHRSIDR